MIRFVLLFACICSLNVIAQDFSKNKYIIEINKKLAKITDAKIKFRQTFNNQEETGVIYFSKNKGLFIKYNTAPISILVNKASVVYYDSKLDQKSQIPTKDSASEIFTKTLQINERDFNIKNVEKAQGAIKVVATSKQSESEGKFTMYFTPDYTLRRVDINSLNNEDRTRIDLHSHTYNKVPPARFKAINIEKDNI